MTEEVEILSETEDFIFATVQSKHDPTTKHNVFYNKAEKRGACDCLGFATHQHCWHLDKIIQRALQADTG